MTQPSNIYAFNQLAAQVLLKLYEAHPREISLSAEDYRFEDLVDDEFFECTVKWLRDEGFLRYHLAPGMQSMNPTFHLSQLTERGYRTLTKPHSAFEAKGERKTFGEQLVGAAEAGAFKGLGSVASAGLRFEFAQIFARIIGM